MKKFFDKTDMPPPIDRRQAIQGLGIAGGMAKFFIHSPLSPLLLFACLGMGLIGLVLTPRQEDPQISVPMVDIFVRYPGASAEQVATLVAEPLERIMSEIAGVKHVYSASQRGQSMITVQFVVGEDMEESLVKLYDKLHSNMDKIPPGVDPPLVKPKAVDDVPVVTLTLWSYDVDDAAMRVLALDVMQQLSEVPDTSGGFVTGGRAEQIRVEVFPERLSGYGLSLDQIAQTIKTANSEKDLGSIEAGDKGFSVYTGAFLRTAQDVNRLMVGTRSGLPIYVRDVADVFSGPEETGRIVQYSTGLARAPHEKEAIALPAVTIAVAKKKGANGVTVANDVLAKMEELKGRLIPNNVQTSVTRNYGETANEKVNDLMFKLMVATGAVTLLIWWFLGFKPAVVTLIVIPVVILMTVFSAWVMGYTIDRVSLFALIFSIGILVDDAIVVVENIYRRWLLEDKCCHIISIDAVREVGNPTILATFTVIAALLPMGFVSGMMGPYMRPIPALGSVAMLFSLFAAFIFTPWLAMLIKPSMRSLHAHSEKEHAASERMEGFYRSIITQLLDSPTKGWGFLLFLVGGFFASLFMFYTHAVTVKILPLDNKPEFNVVINLPEGTALPKTANLASQLTTVLREKIPEITALQTYIGTSSPFNFNGLVRHYYLRRNAWEADIQVQLIHKSKREKTSHDLAVEARNLLTPMAMKSGARIQVVEMPPGPPVLQSMVAEITGPNAATRRQVAADMTALFEKAESIVDVDNYMQQSHEIWRFEVNTEKAVRRGISVDAINRNLGMAMGGARLGDVKRGNILEPTYIVMQVPLEIRSKISSLADLPISTPQGDTVPLGEMGRFVKGYMDTPIFHKDLRPVEYVIGEVTGELDAPIYGIFEVEDLLEHYTTPDGIRMSGQLTTPPQNYQTSGFEWTGEWTVTYETFRDMGLAFGVALILIYMLVVWEFGNFTLPAVIMAPIPLTLLGIIPGHWILDAKFTATSMIGFIALAGIIVRNSILLVDFTQQEITKGISVRDAVILSCKARTRPIVITALALVAGSSVILTDFIFQGMAISLLFGAMISTILTLLVIPLGCVSAQSAFKLPVGSVPAPFPTAIQIQSDLSLGGRGEDEDDDDDDGYDDDDYDPEAEAAAKPGREVMPPAPQSGSPGNASEVDEEEFGNIRFGEQKDDPAPRVFAARSKETASSSRAGSSEKSAQKTPAARPARSKGESTQSKRGTTNDLKAASPEESGKQESSKKESGKKEPAGRRGIRLKPNEAPPGEESAS